MHIWYYGGIIVCFQVLNIDDASQVTFRMFAVITALAERVTEME